MCTASGRFGWTILLLLVANLWFASAGVAEDKSARESKKKTSNGDPQPVALGEATAEAPSYVGPKNISVSVSDDKQVTAILFDNFVADYGPEQAAKRFTPVKVAQLRIPLETMETPRELIGFTFDVRGHVDLDEGALGSVTVIVNGDAQQVTFPLNRPVSDDFLKRFFFLAKNPGGSDGPTSVLRGPLTVQVIAQVKTSQPSDGAALHIDSLDVEAR